jgi:ABC-type dipeptide/oligopeptide/nickel transport system permease component
MIIYVARRILLLIPVLLGVTFITFAMTRIIPGNPVDRMVSPMASQDLRDRVAEEAGLNDPLLVQYYHYIRGLFRGDLGDSFVTSQTVRDDLSSRFGATLELTTYAMLLSIVLAVPLGIAAAVWRDRWVDHVSRLIAVVGVAMPVFWLGLLAIYFLFYRWPWLPAPQGRISPFLSAPKDITGFYSIDSLLTGNWAAFRSSTELMIMPVSVLAFAVMAPLARITRSAMIEALDADYTRAARSLGLSETSVVLRHAFRNALLPLLTMLAIVYGYLLGGVVLVENIFAWPGLGRYVYNAITSSDYPAVQGFILYATTVYVVLFLIVDVLYSVFDPRVRYQ